jgi:xylulose-5-phosphate/fructose-6-phosphate phosphoketolase
MCRSPAPSAEATRVMGKYLRDVMKLNLESKNFRVVSPDETNSNRWNALFEVTNRESMAEIIAIDDHVAPDGRVMEVLSEHMCEGWLEGYLLTGRHGFFSCYEAFVHIIDSMFNQHAKWLKVTRHIPWRRPIASLNYLLTSHVWRQDHNGFSHQDPGFIDHVVNKKADVVRVYLPPDANTLLSVTDHCLRSRNYVNVIVAGKNRTRSGSTWTMPSATARVGLGIWEFASNDQGSSPDVVMACAGDVPTLETLAAVDWLRRNSRSEDPRRQRGRSDDAAAAERTSARHFRQGIRRAVHQGQADYLQLSRLSLADSPAHVPAHQSAAARARLQGGRHHDHAVRYVRAE